MKIVMAIIKPFKLDEVRDALTAIGVQGSPSPKSKAMAGKKATQKSIAAQNMPFPSCRN
jgi:nitrogen regulatory protein PII